MGILAWIILGFIAGAIVLIFIWGLVTQKTA